MHTVQITHRLGVEHAERRPVRTFSTLLFALLAAVAVAALGPWAALAAVAALVARGAVTISVGRVGIEASVEREEV